MCCSIHSGCGGVLRTLRVVGAFPGLGAQRPGGPRLPGGGPHFSREMGRKRAGGKPPGPPFLWPARWHSLVLALGGALSRSLDYFGTHLRALIWKLSFTKCFFSIFFLENAFQIGLRISEGIAPLPYQRQRSPKRASGSKRAIKPGVQGLAPGVLSSGFLPKKAGLPAGVGGEPTSQGPPCNGSNGATYR